MQVPGLVVLGGAISFSSGRQVSSMRHTPAPLLQRQDLKAGMAVCCHRAHLHSLVLLHNLEGNLLPRCTVSAQAHFAEAPNADDMADIIPGQIIAPRWRHSIIILRLLVLSGGTLSRCGLRT